MKLKKKSKILFIIILLFAIIMGINYSNAEDNALDSFYIKESSKTGNSLVVNVYMKTSGATAFKGIIVYDNDLVLTKIENKLSNVSMEIRPNLAKEDERSYKGQKGMVFAAMTDESNKITGEKLVLTLYFDTTNCETDKEYSIDWDTDDIAGYEPNTFVLDGDYKDIQAKGLTYTHEEDNESEDADKEAEEKAKKEAEEKAKAEAEAKAKEEAEKKAAEEKSKAEAEEKAKAEEERKAAEAKAKAEAEEKAKAEADKKAAEEKAKAEAEEKAKKNQQNATNNSNNAQPTNKATNSASSNKENLPQTGSASNYILIGTILIALIMGIVGYINVKRNKM